MAVRVEGLDPLLVSNRIINNDKVGIFTAETVAKYMKKYIPFETGTLGDSYITAPWKVEYVQPYAHYQFEGEVYGPNLPQYVNGVLVGWRSPPHKYPTGRKLKYRSPLAQAHWDIPTQQNQGEAIAGEITEYIKLGV